MNLEELKIDKGEKQKLFINVDGTDVSIPVTIVRGINEGETILFTAGIHCTEYTSIQTIIEIAEDINPENINGNIILVHITNITGFKASNNNSNVFEDQKNLNRVFPGKKDGSLSERIADFIFNRFLKISNYYVDMHGGDVHESLIPYVYYTGGAKSDIVKSSMIMANMINVNYKVASIVRSQGAYNCAGEIGIPSILVERGCSGVWNKNEVFLYKKDIFNLLRGIGILEDENKFKKYNPKDIEDVKYYISKNIGCWYPQKKSGDMVILGECLGIIKDYFGKEIDVIYADFDGVILYQRCTLSINYGNELIALGKV